MIWDWPSNLIPEKVSFDQRGMTISGPLSLSGRSQVASSDTGYWVAAYKSVWAFEPDKVNTVRALRGMLQGGSFPLRVPAFDYAQIPYPLDGAGHAIIPAQTPFDDDATFDDGSGFDSYPVYAVTVGAALVGATQLVIDFKLSGTVNAGHLFSIGDHLYVIASQISITGTQYTVQIWPRLREAVATNVECNFYDPRCKMRFMTDAEMDLLLDRGRFGMPDVAFVEVL